MDIEKVQNENGGVEYHVLDKDIIHAFYSLKQANEYIRYVRELSKGVK